MRLSILIFCLFHGTCWTSDHYCVYQPRTVHVKEGDSVTIPCTYTYPERYGRESQIIIYWGERNGPYCSDSKKSITDNSGNVVDEYKERISRVTHPDHQTESLIIRGLKFTDGDTICCTATIYTTGHNPFTWYDTYGTSLTFEDGRSVALVEYLMAVPGEEMVIPCHYSQETLGEAKQVTWYSGIHERCMYNKKKIYSWDPTHPGDEYPYSLVNPPEDVTLRIHSVQGDESRHYCCHVITRNGTIQSKYSTELIITGPQSASVPFNVTQPYNITGHRGESVTLSCSYTSYMERDVLGVTIYWRLGNLSGPYVYHPYKEMVHPGYRGRTGIQGAADLHIQGVKMSDDSMYYCFVIITLCNGTTEYGKQIQYGEGTRLIVTEPPFDFVMIGSISGAVLLFLLCVILVIIKTSKHRNGADVKRMENKNDEENENIFYSELNKAKLQHKSPAPYQDKKEEIVYSSVVSQAAFESEKRPCSENSPKENILYSELNKTKLQQRSPASNQDKKEEIVYAAVISQGSRT
ncbi:uncharacterized protein LOC130367591 isoform X2 [Hyla sarda]|uniref:uncharacterized protein LOC130367591 isoform X2 n=1 Tax=Hyla sarda TaxID=327740 RepID=UPI0024C22E91|nr:uncharacterized protein LOC130367591 isoform X2 [Hyla sarda]